MRLDGMIDYVPRGAIAHDLVEPAVCSENGRCYPTPAISPLRQWVTRWAWCILRRCGSLGGDQAAGQRGQRAQMVDGEAFLQDFQRAGCRRG